MWTRTFSTAVIPVGLLLILNMRIVADLVSNSGGHVQRFGSFRQQRKEINTRQKYTQRWQIILILEKNLQCSPYVSIASKKLSLGEGFDIWNVSRTHLMPQFEWLPLIAKEGTKWDEIMKDIETHGKHYVPLMDNASHYGDMFKI